MATVDPEMPDLEGEITGPADDNADNIEEVD
jgi:hypothetical protein